MLYEAWYTSSVQNISCICDNLYILDFSIKKYPKIISFYKLNSGVKKWFTIIISKVKNLHFSRLARKSRHFVWFLVLKTTKSRKKPKSTGIQNTFGPNNQTDWSLEKSTFWDVLEMWLLFTKKSTTSMTTETDVATSVRSVPKRFNLWMLFRVCRAALWMLWRSPGGAEGTHSVSDIVRDYNNDLQFLFWRAAWSSLVDWNGGPTPH